MKVYVLLKTYSLNCDVSTDIEVFEDLEYANERLKECYEDCLELEKEEEHTIEYSVIDLEKGIAEIGTQDGWDSFDLSEYEVQRKENTN